MFEIVSIVAAIAGAVASVAAELARRRFGKERADKITTEDRIQLLVTSLREATSHISDIEREINERSKLVQKLRDDAEHYDRLVKLNQPEVEAIAQLLRGEIQEEGRRSFWKGVAVNFMFFLFGAGVSYALIIYAA